MEKHLVLLILVTSLMANTELGMQKYVLLPKDFSKIELPKILSMASNFSDQRNDWKVDSQMVGFHCMKRINLMEKMRKMFAVKNQKVGSAETVSFKINKINLAIWLEKRKTKEVKIVCTQLQLLKETLKGSELFSWCFCCIFPVYISSLVDQVFV